MSFKNYSLTTRKQKGFTLIELLVVIAVIAILASVSLINYNSVRAKARDTTRISDLDQLQKLLEVMKLDSEDGKYPLSTPGYQISGHPWGSEYEGFGRIPEDPSSNSGHPNYAYSSDGDSYQIYVKFEGEPVSSSFACSGSCGPEGGGYNGGVASDSLFGSLSPEGNEGELPSSPPTGLSPEEARQWARNYCDTNFPSGEGGTAIVNGDIVYCDTFHNMWAPTLSSLYKWATILENIRTVYGISSGNCNEIPLEHMNKYPACNACENLTYAGLNGWRLPSHSGSSTGGNYCYLESQLWLYGSELCESWEEDCDKSSSCVPLWEGDNVAQSYGYWSANQQDTQRARSVSFMHGSASNNSTKTSISYRVRCFLGEWEPL